MFTELRVVKSQNEHSWNINPQGEAIEINGSKITPRLWISNFNTLFRKWNN